MKKLGIIIAVFVSMAFYSCSQTPKKQEEKKDAKAQVVHINTEQFKKLVFNFEANKEWKFEGTTPCIIDFYADWCGPCKALSPRLEELAKQYGGKLIVYKVNTDQEQVLAQAMGIQSLPTLLFVPKTGQPQGSVGLLSKESLEKAVKEVLMVN
jgi:thioredoxin 1